MNRLLRLIIAVLSLMGPWLGPAGAELLVLGQNAPTEERESSQEEQDEFVLGSAKRNMVHRAPPPPPGRVSFSGPREGDSLVPPSAREWASTPHRPAPRVLLRRPLPSGEDPLS